MSPQDLALAMVECVQRDIEALFRGEAANARESGLPDPRSYQQTMLACLPTDALPNRPVTGILKEHKLILSLPYHTDKIKV